MTTALASPSSDAPSCPARPPGRLHSITDEQRGDQRVLLATRTDSTGSLGLEFHSAHPDLEAGRLLRLTGQAHTRARDGALVISDPDYRIINTAGEEADTSAGDDQQ